MKLRHISSLIAATLLLNGNALAAVSLNCQTKDPKTKVVRHDFNPGEKVLVQAVLKYPLEAIGKVAKFDASTQAKNAKVKFGGIPIKGLGRNFSIPLWTDNVKLNALAKDDVFIFSKVVSLPGEFTQGALTINITSSVANVGTDSCAVNLNIVPL